MQETLSTSQISLIVSYVFFVQLILELPTGAFADIFGRRTSILLANFLDGIYFFLLANAASMPEFIIATTISGLAESMRSGASEALLYDSLKQDGKELEFASVIAKQSSIFQYGLTISAIMGGFLYDAHRELPFILAGIGQFITAIFSFFLIEPEIDSQKFTLKNYIRQIKDGSREAFKDRRTTLTSWYYIAVGSISWMVMTFYVDFLLIDLGFDNKLRGIIPGFLRLLNIFLIIKLLSNEKIFTRKMTLIFFPALLTFSLLPGIWLQGWWGIPFVAGSMMSSTARWVILGKYTNQVFDSRYRATAISTLSMAIGLIYVVFTLISGPIMEHLGGSKTIFTILGVISLITIPPLAIKLIRNEKTLHKKNVLL